MKSCVLVWGLALATACGSVSSNNDAGNGGGDGGGSGGGDFSLTVDQASIVVPIAISRTVKVDITRSGGFADPVMLAVSGLPAGVTAEVATNPVPDGSTSTDVTFKVDSSAVPGTSTVTVTGTGGGIERSDTIMLELTKITVTGKVRGAFDGTNPSGITVRLVGKGSVVTDAGGNFMFTDVTVPYDIYTVGTGGFLNDPNIPTVYYYDDLTRPDPVIAVAQRTFFVLSTTSSATINGTKSGSGTPSDPVFLIWSNGGNATTSLGANNAYSVGGSWSPQANTNNGTLYGLQLTRATSGAPNAYLGYGSTNATLTASQASTVNLSLATPTVADLTGTITAPAGFPTPSIQLTQQFGKNVATLWSATTTDATSKIPVIAAGKSAFYATAAANNSTTSMVYPALAASTDVSFALPAPATLMAPANAATGVTTTTQFEYSTTPNTVFLVSFTNANGTFFVYTSSSRVTIPAVSEVPVPTNASFSWAVSGFGPHPNVNAAADQQLLEYVNAFDFVGPRHFFTASAGRSFTTQ